LLLTIWFIAEAAVKAMYGTLSLDMGLLFFFVTITLIEGTRACWKARKYERLIKASTIFD
jgi:hypothetical protein